MFASILVVIFILNSFYVIQTDSVVIGAFVMPHGKQNLVTNWSVLLVRVNYVVWRQLWGINRKSLDGEWIFIKTWHNKSSSPLHPNISMYILRTVLYTFAKVLPRRISFKIKSLFQFEIMSLILATLMCNLGVIL